MTRFLRMPFHSFLLAAYFPLWCLQANLGFFAPSSANRAIVLNLLLAGAVLLVLRLVYRSWHKAGVAGSLLIVLLFSFMMAQAGVRALGPGLSPFAVDLSATAILAGIFAAGAILAGRLPAAGGSLALTLNAVAAAMLILPLAAIIGSLPNPLRAGGSGAAQAAEGMPGPDAPSSRPSIFHVVLDGYSRQDVLEGVYGFDNAAFLSELRRLGFFVAEGATSPYSQTLLSMNAVFAAGYINDVLEAGDRDGQRQRRALADRLELSAVRRTLDALGYRSVAVETDYHPVQLDSARLIETGVDAAMPNLFERTLYGRTPLMVWHGRLFPNAGSEISNTGAVRRALEPVRLDDGPAPVFFYNHVVAPHPPFGIDRFGNPRPVDNAGLFDGSHLIHDDPAAREAYRAGYLEKLRYVNSRLTGYLRHLIDDLPGDKVVIVHGDHGGGMWLDQERADRSCLWERLSPLLAVYSSDGRLQQAMTDDFNLVNLYRLVFTTYFAAELPLLESRRFFSTWSAPGVPQEVAASELRRNCPVHPPAALP